MSSEVKINAVRIDGQDNVVTLLNEVGDHEPVAWDQEGYLVAREPIPEGHKVALHDIGEGEVVRKYGHSIGTAARDIARGDHVHTHNLAPEEG
ncbi:MAG: UxaA family hydrolase [Deltaproteobacteria bacterium]|nr:UxaA family hydrolase [Deltaproteobacteria bacterium]MBW2418092.1 UxaA family hydrolase [Deltaproteobacteria bacterium]